MPTLEELERMWGTHEGDLAKQLSRIEELERQMQVVWPREAPLSPDEEAKRVADAEARIQERNRVQRWHATYNAALQGLLAHGDARAHYNAGRAEWIADCNQEARDAADRAHGPLEGKVIPHPDINVGGVTVGEVAALVKAAEALRSVYDEFEGTAASELVELIDERMDSVRAALKPFVGKAESVADAVAKNDAAVLVHVARCIQKHGLTGNLRAALDEALESFSEAP
jgi:hypothetical protein